jgi:hypothetical protein
MKKMNYCDGAKSLSVSRRLAALLFVAAFSGVLIARAAFAEDAAEPKLSGACFDIVRPATDMAAGAILLNRCTGETWLLVRSRNRNGKAFVYRWHPIGRGTMKVAAIPPSAPVAPRVRLPASPNSDRCFTFSGRRFCE